MQQFIDNAMDRFLHRRPIVGRKTGQPPKEDFEFRPTDLFRVRPEPLNHGTGGTVINFVQKSVRLVLNNLTGLLDF